MIKKDYYEVLGVSRNAKTDEIRSAYFKLAKKYHPDVNKEKNSTEKFAEINEAYEILSDSKKRNMYDQTGSRSEDIPNYSQNHFTDKKDSRRRSSYNSQNNEYVDHKERDIFEEFFKMFGESGSFFDGSKTFNFNYSSNKGNFVKIELKEDVYIEVKIDFIDMIMSNEKTIEYTRKILCTSCRAKGCSLCKNKGWVLENVVLPIKVTEDIKFDTKYVVEGNGNQYSQYLFSNLVIVFKQGIGRDNWKRLNNDFYLPIIINFTFCLYGGDIVIPALDAKMARVYIPIGIQSGDIVLIKQKIATHSLMLIVFLEVQKIENDLKTWHNQFIGKPAKTFNAFKSDRKTFNTDMFNI